MNNKREFKTNEERIAIIKNTYGDFFGDEEALKEYEKIDWVLSIAGDEGFDYYNPEDIMDAFIGFDEMEKDIYEVMEEFAEMS